MPQFLPLFLRNALLDFADQKKLGSDSESIRDYFENNKSEKLKQLLEETNHIWQKYLDRLAVPRRKKLFKTTKPIPNENKILEELAFDGNDLAAELLQIKKANLIGTRIWPLDIIEKNRCQYIDLKAKPYSDPSAHQQYLAWIISNLLTEIYYPSEFFKKSLFKFETKYQTFPYKFLDDVFQPQEVYIWYLLFIEKGPAHFFKNIEDVVIYRYVVTKMMKMSVYGLLDFFLWLGNDENQCNRFFTRRMKRNITTEKDDLNALINSIGNAESEGYCFKNFFLAKNYSNTCAKDPFQKSFGDEPGLIEQAIYNHIVGNYSAAVNLLFPIIEGVCWDISVAEHLKNGGVYTSSSNLTTRNIKKRQLINEAGLPISRRCRAPTLNELLESTKMKYIFHTQFLKSFCGELFPEDRNPILHGSKLEYNEPFQSSRLLLVLEYLHGVIKNQKYVYPTQLDPENYWTFEKSVTEQTTPVS